MSKIVTMVPTWASMKAKIVKPDNWDGMNPREQKEYFAEHMEAHASLCHQCADGIESNFELDSETYDRADHDPGFSEEE